MSVPEQPKPADQPSASPPPAPSPSLPADAFVAALAELNVKPVKPIRPPGGKLTLPDPKPPRPPKPKSTEPRTAAATRAALMARVRAAKVPIPKKPGPKPKPAKGRPGEVLNREIRLAIIDGIKRGCFPHVAASGAGVHKKTWQRWMASEHPKYVKFRLQCESAHAQARMAAEEAVYKKDKFTWLRYGPGRERDPNEPGWRESAKLEHTGPGGGPIRHESVDVKLFLADPQALDLVGRLMERVDARKALPGGPGEVRGPRELEGGEAPAAAEPEAPGGGVGAVPAADRGNPCETREGAGVEHAVADAEGLDHHARSSDG